MDESAHTRIKLCGFTDPGDGTEAIALGVDFMGLIFYPPSSRYVEPERAARLVVELRARAAAMGKPMPRVIGVFVDETPEAIARVRETVGLDGVQFSGDESPEAVRYSAPIRFAACHSRRWTGWGATRPRPTCATRTRPT